MIWLHPNLRSTWREPKIKPSDADKGVLVALEAAYFRALENIALVKFKALTQFLRQVKTANINHL